jgi:uncharacterized membrane protein
LSIDPATGLIAGLISFYAYPGSPYPVVITATDDSSPALSDTVEFTWDVSDMNTVFIPAIVGGG